MTDDSTKTIYCSCNGENENCYKCGGTGTLTAKDLQELEHPQPLGGVIKEAEPTPFTVTKRRPRNKSAIKPEKSKGRKPKKIKPKLASGKGKKKRSQNISQYHDNHEIKSSMQEALEKIINPPQNSIERNLDKTRDYWKIRDNGQFGSYPSHDDFDE